MRCTIKIDEVAVVGMMEGSSEHRCRRGRDTQ